MKQKLSKQEYLMGYEKGKLEGRSEMQNCMELGCHNKVDLVPICIQCHVDKMNEEREKGRQEGIDDVEEKLKHKYSFDLLENRRHGKAYMTIKNWAIFQKEAITEARKKQGFLASQKAKTSQKKFNQKVKQ